MSQYAHHLSGAPSGLTEREHSLLAYLTIKSLMDNFGESAGKTSLVAAMALYDLLLGQEGASIVVAATDERQAGLCFGVAARMVELHDNLAARVQVFQDKLIVPVRGASFQVLPAVAKRLEGLDFSLASWTSLGAWTARSTRWWWAPAASARRR